MIVSLRDAVLIGVRHAVDTIDQLHLRESSEGQGKALDVFEVIADLEIPLLFQPLKNLLGSAITVAPGNSGILVTTARDLFVQRFVAAHELGHIVMGHKRSFDADVGEAGRYGPKGRSYDEVAADIFAAELLLPKWLIRHFAKRHTWTRDALRDAETVYQLSLRTATSFQATCWGLASQDLVTQDEARTLTVVPPKRLKERLLGQLSLANPWSNVWHLSEGDSGSRLYGSVNDILVMNFVERATSGYLWFPVSLPDSLRLIDDQRVPTGNTDLIGSATRRRLIYAVEEPGVFELQFIHRRPWTEVEPSLATVTLNMSCWGKEEAGVPRHQRRAALGVA